ncbi:hypothetical protein BVER_05676 [Candidatus Burkholderia verschuerenii]|uniref:Uncharacterized protein n=1 Tax=Candidatus Burkholderia verschuerenii TaxID=242163 RepID=A0A0L0ME79_9BURK|nr:hypothetical protein [Candidatus Burkholderia verschuerenii]KND60591.1 hypothetical protein BVER_05676 [Candidatus Burkholderia verschuerenii]
MGKIIPIRRGGPSPDEIEAGDHRKTAADRAWQVLKATGLGMLGVLRYTAFVVLLFLRRPIRFVLNLCGSGGLLGFFMIAFGFSGPNRSSLLWLSGGTAAIGMFGAWFYDSLVLWLSPRPIILA